MKPISSKKKIIHVKKELDIKLKTTRMKSELNKNGIHSLDLAGEKGASS